MEYLYSYSFLNVKRCQKAGIVCVNLAELVIAFFLEEIKKLIKRAYKKIDTKKL